MCAPNIESSVFQTTMSAADGASGRKKETSAGYNILKGLPAGEERRDHSLDRSDLASRNIFHNVYPRTAGCAAGATLLSHPRSSAHHSAGQQRVLPCTQMAQKT